MRISLLLCFVFSAMILGLARSSAQTPTQTNGSCYTRFRAPVVAAGTGNDTSISIINSNLFIEDHSSSGTSGQLIARLGTLANEYFPIIEIGSAVTYGDGYHPSVSMNSDGLILEVHDNRPGLLAGSEMFWRFGKVNPSGGENQDVTWIRGGGIRYDAGRYPQVAMNDSGTIVEVHESDNLASHRLYYRVGHEIGTDRAPYYYTIIWDSGAGGIDYDAGRRPHITIDSAGNVVEVHQASSDNNLHYRRGRVNNSGTRIDWAPAAVNGRYRTGDGSDPTVSMSDNGYVLETHKVGQYVGYIDGNLNGNTSNVVDWSSTYVLATGGGSSASQNGTVAVAVYRRGTSSNLELMSGSVHCP